MSLTGSRKGCMTSLIKKIHQFGERFTLLEGTSQTSQDIGTQEREVSAGHGGTG